ncbi:MAG: hypothetical protein H6623_04245 [Bdellovibrionaceae bacterium]|nr:hypothetical protein [Pseudobdellovibrionaceae bacterium]
MIKTLVTTLFVLILPLTSHALLELRAGYGVNTLDKTDYTTAQLTSMSGFNLDAIFEPPMLTDLGLGLRYESLGLDVKTGGVNVGSSDLKRLSALVNYRVIDLFAYLGFIGTFGLNSDLSTTIGGVKTSYDAKFNYSIGVEGGVNLGFLSVGAEVGKIFGKFTHTGVEDIKLDSIYAKVLVGFDI